MRVVKSFGREKEEIERFSKQAYKLYEQNITANEEQAVNTSLMTFSVYLAVGIQLLLGGFMVLRGRHNGRPAHLFSPLSADDLHLRSDDRLAGQPALTRRGIR